MKNVRLVVTDEGHYIFEGGRVSDAEFKERLREIKASGVKIDLHILGSERATYERVGRAVKIAQDTDVELVGFITEPPAGMAAMPAGSAASR